MQTIEAKAILSAKDATGGTFSAIASKINGMNKAAANANRVAQNAGAAAQRANAVAAQSAGWAATAAARVIPAVAAAEIGRRIVTAVVDDVKKYARRDQSSRYAGLTGEMDEGQRRQMDDQVESLSRKLGVPYEQVQEAAASLLSAGESFDTMMKMLPEAIKTAKASNATPADISAMDSALKQMGIKDSEYGRANDMAAKGGKLGKFELKDMASRMPELAPWFKGVGLGGIDNLPENIAWLETLRKGAGSNETATTNAINVMQKYSAQESRNKLKEKLGYDLQKRMDQLKKEGKSWHEARDITMDEMAALAKKKGWDHNRLIDEGWQDMQINAGLKTTYDPENRREQKIMAGKIRDESAGTVQKDLDYIQQSTQSQLDKMNAAYDQAGQKVGEFAAAIANATGALTTATAAFSNAADNMAGATKFLKEVQEKGLAKATYDRMKDSGDGDYGPNEMDWEIQKAQIRAREVEQANEIARQAAARQSALDAASNPNREVMKQLNDRDFGPSKMSIPQRLSEEAAAPAEVKVETNVTGQATVDVQVQPSGELITIAQQAKQATIDLKAGMARMDAAIGRASRMGNGPGSVGKSSPDAAPVNALGGR